MMTLRLACAWAATHTVSNSATTRRVLNPFPKFISSVSPVSSVVFADLGSACQPSDQQIEKLRRVNFDGNFGVGNIFLTNYGRNPGSTDGRRRTVDMHLRGRFFGHLRAHAVIARHRAVTESFSGGELAEGFDINVIVLPLHDGRIEEGRNRQGIVHIRANDIALGSGVVDRVAGNLPGGLAHRILRGLKG